MCLGPGREENSLRQHLEGWGTGLALPPALVLRPAVVCGNRGKSPRTRFPLKTLQLLQLRYGLLGFININSGWRWPNGHPFDALAPNDLGWLAGLCPPGPLLVVDLAGRVVGRKHHEHMSNNQTHCPWAISLSLLDQPQWENFPEHSLHLPPHSSSWSPNCFLAGNMRNQGKGCWEVELTSPEQMGTKLIGGQLSPRHRRSYSV